MDFFTIYAILSAFLPLIYLLIAGFFIYFAIKVLMLINIKNKNDEELNVKLGKLLNMLEKNDNQNF